MPIHHDGTAAADSIRLGPALPLELFWVSLTVGRPGAVLGLEGHGAAALRRRVEALWNDGEPGLPELLVLAERAGLLLGTELAPLLDALPAAVAARHQPRLSIETAESRVAIRGRLRQLRARPALRDRYRRLLTDLWSLARPAWQAAGMAEAEAASQRVGGRLHEGTPVGDLIPRQRPFRGDIDTAAGDGTLAVAPSFFATSWVFFDLDSTFLMGMPVHESEVIEGLREAARQAARGLKVLADPTRLAILAYLARTPATITETARAFRIAQPTASVHFRALRDARLVVDSRDRGRNQYSVDQARLRALLADAGAAVLGDG